ncbi:MAG: hypothetical protein M3327_02320, partial [Actinomycetota bacterium]|nr:hypothetical protein [Actinomycetota bacterium]
MKVEELDFLLSLPSDRWVEVDGDAGSVRRFAEKGLVVTDEADGPFAELRRRDEELAAGRWNVYSALYHFMTRWRGVDIRRDPGDGASGGPLPPIRREDVEQFVSAFGRPPEPFHAAANPLGVLELPLVRRDDGLYGLLARRRTTRGFDADTPMTLEQLALVLYYVWGCHGYVPMLPGMFALKRTSPSGGGLHPVEAYPLVTNVEGITPGLYHYNSRDHS